MRIKPFSSTFFSGIIVFLFLQGCQKYPENEGISLRSRTERVSNTWKVDNYKINGNDFTSLVSGYTETFQKDGRFNYAWGITSGHGSWNFQNKDQEIRLYGSDEQSSRTLVIEKLEEKVFWYHYMEGNDKHELHLVQQ